MNSILKQKVTAVFDLGKPSRKNFFFDSKYQEVFKESFEFDEIIDEDGLPTKDLKTVQNWIESLFGLILTSEKHTIQAVNFWTYRASFAHLNAN
jgi:hypothetical protein